MQYVLAVNFGAFNNTTRFEKQMFRASIIDTKMRLKYKYAALVILSSTHFYLPVNVTKHRLIKTFAL